jgi:hypothetical protein
MKTNSKSCLLFAAAVWASPFVSAQSPINIHDFTAFQSPDTTLFVGDWALNGDPISGDTNPIASFSQGAGFYNFIGGTNADTSGAYYFLPGSAGDLTGYGLLQISARLLEGNTASSFAVSLFNFASNETAVAIFDTADFAGAGFTSILAPLTPSGSFDFAGVDAFLIGGVSGGTGTLNLAIDHLAVAARDGFNPVPESSTYGMLGGVLVLAVVLSRRLRMKSRSNSTEILTTDVH